MGFDSNAAGLYRPALVAIFLLTVFACEGGGGCSGCSGCSVQPIPGSYPLEERVENAAQVRLTESGIEFLETNATSVIETLIPGGLNIPIPRTDGRELGNCFYLCPDNNCTARLEIESLDLVPTGPNRVRALLRVQVQTLGGDGERAPIPVRLRVLGGIINCNADPGGSSCSADVDTTGGSRPYIGLAADIRLVTDERDARRGYTRVDIEELTLADGEGIERDDLEISCESGLLDFLIGLFEGTFVNLIRDQLDSLLNGALDEQLCTTRGDFGCPTGTQAVPDESPGSICRFPADGDPDEWECVPTLLGTDGRGDLGGAFLGGISPGTHAFGQFILAAGGDGEAVNNGMTINMFGGFMSTDPTFEISPAHNACVPVVEPPPIPEIGEASAFRGNTIPGTDTETHVGLGLSEDFLNYAGYGMFDSGLLCLGLGTRVSQQLSTALLSAVITSLNELSYPLGNAPVQMVLRPQLPPVFTVGTAEEEPTLRLALNQAKFDFYVWSTERYIRFMTLQSNLVVDINLGAGSGEACGMGSDPDARCLVPEIVGIEPSESSLENTELLSESPELLAGILEDLISMLAGMLSSTIPPFELPAISGFELEIPEGGVIGITEGEDRFLGIFANLALGSTALSAPIETTLTTSDITLNPEAMALETYGQGRNSVWLHLGAEGPAHVAYEFSYRIDEGPWSTWSRDQRRYVDDRVLLLEAEHVIEARARVVGESTSVDTTPARATVTVDVQAPRVIVDRESASVLVHAFDIITPSAELEYRFRMNGAWTEWQHESRLELEYDEDEAIEVEVRDSSGNIGRATAPLIRGLPNSDAASGCGCRTAEVGSTDTPWFTLAGLALAMMWVFGRRRRRPLGRTSSRRRLWFLPLLLLVAAGLASGCECSEAVGCDEGCTPARPPAETQGAICCEASNECADYDLASLCEPGFACAVSDLEVDESCAVRCSDCQRQPALDEGIVATHLDAVVDADGTFNLSGYAPGDPSGNRLYGDLVFAQWDGTGQPDWEIVDGAPSDPVTNDPDGWRGGVSAAGDDVGRWTSIARAGDTLYIAYYDATNRALKLAQGGPNDWSVHTVDDTGDSGKYASVAVTDEGALTISYLRIRASSEQPDQIESAIVVASANVLNPSSSDDWTTTELDVATMDCRPEHCGGSTQCLEGEGTCVTPTTDCEDECDSGNICHAGECRSVLPATFIEDMPPAMGLYSSLSWLGGTELGLVYYDRTSGNLYARRYDGAAWSDRVLIDGYAAAEPDAPPVGDSGQGADLFIDSEGLWHIVYIDGAEEALRYATLQGTEVLTRETVDDGSVDPDGERFTDGRHIIGDDASIVVLPTGQIRVVYQDATAHRLVLATREAETDWTRMYLDQEDSSGYWAEQALVESRSYVVHWWRSRNGRNTDNGLRSFILE